MKTSAVEGDKFATILAGGTFMQAVERGECALSDVDDLVDEWHRGSIGKIRSLQEVLGLSHVEYVQWVRDSSALERLVSQRVGNGVAPGA